MSASDLLSGSITQKYLHESLVREFAAAGPKSGRPQGCGAIVSTGHVTERNCIGRPERGDMPPRKRSRDEPQRKKTSRKKPSRPSRKRK